MLPSYRAALHLARWLGPWSSSAAMPGGILRQELMVPPSATATREMRAWLYQPADGPTRGSYLISPGLHYAGPSDPRLDRFCRILAGAGYAVLAPFLPDFMELRVRSSLSDDLERCMDLLVSKRAWTCGRAPALFSISFGALPALALASGPRYRKRLRRLFLFGGYADWSQTIEYCLTGSVDGQAFGKRDPLNQPVVYLNLLDRLDGVPADREALTAAWMRYVHATWGRPEMKVDDRWQPLARQIAADLSSEGSAFFLLGCGLTEGGYERCLAALQDPGTGRLLNPLATMSEIVCPVSIVHGRDDDVIPYTQSETLFRRIDQVTEAEIFITGLIDHTRSAAKLSAGIKEIGFLRDICTRLASP